MLDKVGEGSKNGRKMSDVIYGRSLMGLWNDQINPIRDYWTADLLNVHKITTFTSYALLRWCATQWSQEILRDPPDQQKFSDITTHRNTLVLFYITSTTPFHSQNVLNTKFSKLSECSKFKLNTFKHVKMCHDVLKRHKMIQFQTTILRYS